MFGSTEISAASDAPRIIEALIPTIALPFLLVSTILSSVITAIAGWFGIVIKADGAKNLLKAFLKPKVLLAALALNGVVWLGYAKYRQFENQSRPLWLIQMMNPLHHRENSNSALLPRAQLGASTKLEQVWESKLPKTAFRGLKVHDQSIFAASMDGRVYELDRETGKILREFFIGQPSVPQPEFHLQTMFVGEGEHITTNARIYVFDLKTGRLIGTVQTNGHTEGDLVKVAHGGRTWLFAPAGSDGLYAIDADSFEVVWHSPMTHFDSGVTESDGILFAATSVEKNESGVIPALYSLDLKTGTVIWKIDLADSGWSRPLIVGDQVCVALGDIYHRESKGRFSCFDKSSGAERWTLEFAAPLFATPILSSTIADSAFVIDFSGTICRMDLSSHRTIWCKPIPHRGLVFATLALDSLGRIVVPTSEGVEVIEPENGNVIVSWTPENSESPWKPTPAGATVIGEGVVVIDGAGVMRRLRWAE